ncbi:MAG: O-antigen ligase family protein [Bacteroidales bacterium]|nr:O-antigen ligase family protein [Bacteroidales bacterium]
MIRLSESSKKNLWIYLAAILFVVINGLLVYNEVYILNLLPFVLLLLLLAFLALDKLFLVIVFLTPLSVSLAEIIPGLSVNLYLPTEPLLFGAMILFVFKLGYEKQIDRKIFTHPVSLAIYFNLIWIFITSVTSTLPVVSLKFFIARLWFVTGYFFLAAYCFKKPGNIKLFFKAYLAGLSLVIIYTLINHSRFGLINQEAAHSAVHPFYNDHTAYGAVIAMYIPVVIAFLFSLGRKGSVYKIQWFFLLLLLSFAMVFSYTRAGWISLAGGFVVYLLIKLKVKFYLLAMVIGMLIAMGYMFRTNIMMELEQNRQDSSADLAEHVQSISNITSDASNLERINRWESALRMFKQKPLLGWGPGTYMFLYAPFQHSTEKTIISTNFGDLGNAHSEYIGPLAESGVLGTISFLLIVITTIFTGLRVWYKQKGTWTGSLALGTFIGLTTYFIHGMMNNFLDTDKASAPFWGFIAVLVVLDIYGKEINLADK